MDRVTEIHPKSQRSAMRLDHSWWNVIHSLHSTVTASFPATAIQTSRAFPFQSCSYGAVRAVWPLSCVARRSHFRHDISARCKKRPRAEPSSFFREFWCLWRGIVRKHDFQIALKTLQNLKNLARCPQSHRFWSFWDHLLASIFFILHNSQKAHILQQIQCEIIALA